MTVELESPQQQQRACGTSASNRAYALAWQGCGTSASNSCSIDYSVYGAGRAACSATGHDGSVQRSGHWASSTGVLRDPGPAILTTDTAYALPVGAVYY
jgi:hypothetical protein